MRAEGMLLQAPCLTHQSLDPVALHGMTKYFGRSTETRLNPAVGMRLQQV